MSALKEFIIHVNHFEGALPANGLQVMREVSAFYALGNRFAGTLPTNGFRVFAELHVLSIQSNDFEGEMSEAQYAPCFVVLCYLCGRCRQNSEAVS
eukprot:3615037-Amphidinium_carterae.1